MKRLHHFSRSTLVCGCAFLAHVTAQAQRGPGAGAEPPPATAGPQTQPGMSQMDHSRMNHGEMPRMEGRAAAPQHSQEGSMESMDTGAKQGMSVGPMQGGKPPPDARDPNVYAEGARRADLGGMEMADTELFGRVLVNNLELAHGGDEHGQHLEAEAWYGGDYNKAWFKAEGDRRDGRLETLRTEALWNRAFAPFWSTQLGVRHDTGSGDSRNWLAFGVQGLAPYWFETEATGYWRAGGGFGARIDVKYEALITQRLILEPQFGANLYSKTDRERGTGAGLSDVELGLRLRYEIRRQFAPYIGVTWSRKFGNTARFTEMEGGNRQSVTAVAGVRIWY
jgi:copper resistance protein B